MSCSADRPKPVARTPHAANAILAGEAGVPFVLPPAAQSGIDPFVEWLSLMEVVEMLCPAWPVRDKPFQGNDWRI